MTPYKIGMVSLGCPKNQVDAEMMIFKLKNAGFEITTNENDADLIIVNTCGFIEDAKKEAIDAILETSQLKNTGVLKALVVTGCLAERYKEQIKETMPEVDAVIGIGANGDIVKVCQKALSGLETEFFPSKQLMPLGDKRTVSTPNHWAYLKVADGCSNKCTYCAIPGIRGEFRSRKIEDIVNEAKNLVAGGVKELILIAQDTTKYGEDIYNRTALVDLLKELVKIEELKWIRIFYCYPDRITDGLLELMANEEKICNYIDIPLQHANEKILRKMNRTGDSKSLTKLIAKIRKYMPDVSIRTTFMVGFPYENDEAFADLAEFVEVNKFDRLGCFTYSPEEDTPAADFDCQIEQSVKDRRASVIMDQQFEITKNSNEKRVGNTFEAIIDGFDSENNVYVGRSYMDAPEIDTGILINSETPLKTGDFVRIIITSVDNYDLIGKAVN